MAAVAVLGDAPCDPVSVCVVSKGVRVERAATGVDAGDPGCADEVYTVGRPLDGVPLGAGRVDQGGDAPAMPP